MLSLSLSLLFPLSRSLSFSNPAPQQIVMQPPSQSQRRPGSPEEILLLIKCYICQLFYKDNLGDKERGFRLERERGREEETNREKVRESECHSSDSMEQLCILDSDAEA